MNKDVSMLKLGLKNHEIEIYKEKKIEFNKKVGNLLKKSRAESKRSKCYICGKECSSFCNSHSVPRFCLENIAINGHVLYSGNLVDLPMFEKPKGVNEAGVFWIICNDCDSKVFRDYENPDNYFKEPTDKMLSQMAMKNYLRSISKREFENSLYPNIDNLATEVIEHIKTVNTLDLKEYIDGFNYSKKACESKWDNHFFLGYFELLDYVVPIAFQNSVALITDLEGSVINNIYNHSTDYKLKEIHIAVLPLKNHSVIAMFIKNKEKRYRSFLKQFRKLSTEEKLKVINYIIFSYSEDVFIYKSLDIKVLENEELKKVVQQSTISVATNPFENSLEEAKKTFDFKNRNLIPNLLDRKYKIR